MRIWLHSSEATQQEVTRMSLRPSILLHWSWYFLLQENSVLLKQHMDDHLLYITAILLKKTKYRIVKIISFAFLPEDLDHWEKCVFLRFIVIRLIVTGLIFNSLGFWFAGTHFALWKWKFSKVNKNYRCKPCSRCDGPDEVRKERKDLWGLREEVG